MNADGLVVKIEEQQLADLKNVPVEQHQSMLQAIAKEFNDLIAIGTFTGIEVPTNRKAISSRIVLKAKHRADGAFDKYKARLVARGFLQKLGVDFFSTFSPMATLASIRILLLLLFITILILYTLTFLCVRGRGNNTTSALSIIGVP